MVEPHAAVGPVATDSRHLVWESGPIESDQFQPTLHDRNLAAGATKTLSSNVDPLFGLASTPRFVFYARSSGYSTSVVRVLHAGTHTRVLTDALVTPIASRGNVVAWGEQSGPTQRVVAYTGARRWIVAQRRRCTTEGCYRLGDVTVAKGGIVFTRDAVGSQPSFVVRQRARAERDPVRCGPTRPPARPRPILVRRPLLRPLARLVPLGLRGRASSSGFICEQSTEAADPARGVALVLARPARLQRSARVDPGRECGCARRPEAAGTPRARLRANLHAARRPRVGGYARHRVVGDRSRGSRVSAQRRGPAWRHTSPPASRRSRARGSLSEGGTPCACLRPSRPDRASRGCRGAPRSSAATNSG